MTDTTAVRTACITGHCDEPRPRLSPRALVAVVAIYAAAFANSPAGPHRRVLKHLAADAQHALVRSPLVAYGPTPDSAGTDHLVSVFQNRSGALNLPGLVLTGMASRRELEGVLSAAMDNDDIDSPAVRAILDARDATLRSANPLSDDPIPANRSVYDSMPGQTVTGFVNLLGFDTYVVQLRSGGHWILPNHDDPAAMTRMDVGTALCWLRDRGYGKPARFSWDNGTVYASNGMQAARYIPALRIPGHRPGHCPGCHTAYATNGDGPCPAFPSC